MDFNDLWQQFKEAVERIRREHSVERLVTRPYQNEHAARINDPGKYKKFARKNGEFGDGIDVIYGVKDDDKTEVQAIRFDSKKFTPAQAKKWLKDHDYTAIEFEDAIKEESRAISMQRLYGLIWEKLQTPGEDGGESDGDEYIGLIDVYNDNGSLYALTNCNGKLYRQSIVVNGEEVILGGMEQVMEQHVPASGEQIRQAHLTRTVINRDASGNWRWFSVSATSVLNRVGQIDSRDLFDSFVQHADETGEYPIRQFYHQGAAFRTGQADFLARDGYCYLTSGVFDDTPLALAEVRARVRDGDYWGESIGFLPTVEPDMVEVIAGVNLPCYRQGVNIEISTLPEKEAASLFTATRQTEVRRMLNGKAYQAFLKLWGGDEVKAKAWLEEHPEELNRAIETNGLITRTTDEVPGGVEAPGESITGAAPIEAVVEPAVETREEPAPPGGEEPPEPDEDEDDDLELDPVAVQVITQAVVESEVVRGLLDGYKQLTDNLTQAAEAITAMTAQLEAIETEVGRLQASDSKRRKQTEVDMPRRTIKQTLWRPRVDRAKQRNEEEEIDEVAVWEQEKKSKGIPDW